MFFSLLPPKQSAQKSESYRLPAAAGDCSVINQSRRRRAVGLESEVRCQTARGAAHP